MTFAARARLAVFAMVAIAVVALGVGGFLERELRVSLTQHAKEELERHANTVGALLEAAPEGSAAVLDAVADRAAGVSGAHITIADSEGRTLGDSTLTPQELPLRGPKLGPEELATALRDGMGSSVDPSSGEYPAWIFVTVRVPGPGGGPPLLARASRPMSGARAATGRAWRIVLWGAGATMFVTGTLLWFSTGAAPRVASREDAVPEDEVSEAPPVEDAPEPVVPEERSLLSLQRMADDLETTLQTLSAERNRFEAVLQTMDQAVLATDADQCVTTVKPRRTQSAFDCGWRGRANARRGRAGAWTHPARRGRDRPRATFRRV